MNNIEYITSLCRSLFSRALRSRLVLVSLLALVFTIFYRSGETWNPRNNDLNRSIKHLRNVHIYLDLKYDDGYHGLYRSITIFEPSTSFSPNRSAIHELAINIEAEPELRNGPAIAKMWNQFANGLSGVIHSSQELNSRGKWDLRLLFLEFKTLHHRNDVVQTEFKGLIRKILTYLATMLSLLEDLDALIVQTNQMKATVYSTLYNTEKHLRLDMEEGGLARWLTSHFRGNRALLRRQTELNLAQLAIWYATGASEFLSGIETKVKLCKDNILTVQDSITTKQADGTATSPYLLWLIFLESIFTDVN